MLMDGWTDDGVTGILIAHLGAFGSGELIRVTKSEKVPILGIFSRKTILMFRVGLKKLG